MNVLRTLKNNWKKSIFFGGILGYGVDYGYDKFRINQLMRSACSESVQYGDQLLADGSNNRRVIVILNPTAKKRSAEKAFEKYCGPVLYLAGIRVDVVKTESEGFARTYVSQLEELPDAILVAGGDGTLSEVVTGLMRRSQGSSTKLCPIGILPVGRTNSVAGRMFTADSSGSRVSEVERLTHAALSVIRGELTKKDVLKIEILPEVEVEESKPPIYALSSLHWGALRDTLAMRDKYWYFGGLREKAAVFFCAWKSSVINWDCRGTMATTPPCAGCVQCYEQPGSGQPEYKGKNWWSFMVPTKSSKAVGETVLVDGQDVRRRVNPQCSVQRTTELEGVNEVLLTTGNVEQGLEGSPRMHIRVSGDVSKTDWIQDGWRRTNDPLGSNVEPVEARTVELKPERKVKEEGEKEEFYSIDNEAFEVKPIRVTLLPGSINVFN